MDPLLIVEKLKEATKGLLDAEATELIELVFRRESGRWALRFTVDKSGGINLAECAELNKRLSKLLDELNLVEEHYILEVCSPGLDRLLTKRSDFERVKDKDVRFTYKTAEDRVDVVAGIVRNADDEKVFVEKKDGGLIEISYNSIIKAREDLKF